MSYRYPLLKFYAATKQSQLWELIVNADEVMVF